MVCEAKEGVGLYRPQQPQQMPFHQLACPPKPWRRRVERFYPESERVYEE